MLTIGQRSNTNNSNVDTSIFYILCGLPSIFKLDNLKRALQYLPKELLVFKKISF